MKFISLFSGIGGFDLGLERAGMECVLQVDLYEPELIPELVADYESNLRNTATEKEAKKIKDNWRSLINAGRQLRFMSEKQWPETQRINGVQNVNKNNIPPISLAVGGFPCQDISIAGCRAGLAGKRSGLWFEFYRIIEETQPEWVVIENVPGLLSSNGGRDMGTIIGGLAKLGYRWAYRCLDAQFYGVPQRRRRVFIVGHLAPRRRCLGKKNVQNNKRLFNLAAEVLFERDSSPWDSAPSREAGEEVARPLANSTTTNHYDESQQTYVTFAPQAGGNTGLNINEDLSGTLQENQVMAMAFGGNNTSGSIDVSTALNAGDRRQFENETFVCGALPAHSARHGHTMTTQQAAESGELVAATLNSGGNDGGFRTEPGEHLIPIGINGSELGYSLRANPSHSGDKGDGGINTSFVIQTGVRRLTPIECERLQGFPDDFTADQSDSARYRQLGNAVAVPVARWLGKRIMEVVNND